jgi:hypothetical protein
MPEPPELWTRADIAAQVERVRVMLKTSGLGPNLLRLFETVENLAAELDKDTRNVPFGLLPTKDDEARAAFCAGEMVALKPLRPMIYATPRYLVLPPPIAEAYELVDFKVGKNSQLFDDGFPVPLDTFSAAFLANDRLSNLQEWKGADGCPPGVRIEMLVQPRTNTAMPFRGVLWCECSFAMPQRLTRR